MFKLTSLLPILLIFCIEEQCNKNIMLTKIVQLKHGKVRGYVQSIGEEKVEFFEGIRYGKANRFEKPHPVSPWPGVYDAISYRAACPQFGTDMKEKQPQINETNIFDEDCLFLNVWRPSKKSTTLRPVMVWIYGGRFEIGTIFNSRYDASNIAAKGDLITVSINYRLGVLGFGYGGGIPANLGLHDQIFALKWIQENIQYFEGDPTQVTIYAGSSGSACIGALILSPHASGLFNRAIMQSGSPNIFISTASLSVLAQKTHILGRRVKCSDFETDLETVAECLRTKSIEELQEGSINDFQENRYFHLGYGDELIPMRPDVALKEGKFNQDIDLLFGLTRDEGLAMSTLFLPEIVSANLTIDYTKQLIMQFMKSYDQSLIAEEVADYYVSKLSRLPDQNELKTTVGSVCGDFQLVCPAILFAEQFAKSAQKPNQNRYYAYRLMQMGLSPPDVPTYPWTGVAHGQEISFIFKNPQSISNSATQELSENMIMAWVSFARTGNPGKLGTTQWEEAFVGGYGADAFTTRYMHLEAGHYHMVDRYYKPVCNFWKPKLSKCCGLCG